MGKRNSVLLETPEGLKKEIPSMTTTLMRLDSPQKIASHFARVDLKENPELNDEDAWPRTYQITDFAGKKHAITVNGEKTMHLSVLNVDKCA